MKNKNLRRLLAVFLCLVMVLSLLTACGKNDDDDDDGDEKETTSATDTTKETDPTESDDPEEPTKGSSKDPTKATTATKEPEKDDSKNTYKTPLDVAMEDLNAKSYKEYEEAELKQTNGLYETQLENIRKLEKKSEFYEDDLDDYEDDIREMVEECKDEYGNDYKFYYEIDDEEKLKKSEVTEYQDELREYAAEQLEAIKAILDDDDALENTAEAWGLKKSQMEDILELYEEIYKDMKKIEVSEGYELDVTVYIKGKELDEPEEYDESSVKVYKVGGKWVLEYALEFTYFSAPSSDEPTYDTTPTEAPTTATKAPTTATKAPTYATTPTVAPTEPKAELLAEPEVLVNTDTINNFYADVKITQTGNNMAVKIGLQGLLENEGVMYLEGEIEGAYFAMIIEVGADDQMVVYTRASKSDAFKLDNGESEVDENDVADLIWEIANKIVITDWSDVELKKLTSANKNVYTYDIMQSGSVIATLSIDKNTGVVTELKNSEMILVVNSHSLTKANIPNY